jgi:aspartyl-tRNA(Asn)/glutamyl-tRNA(Gln) amidotransferase subunit C
MIPYAAPIFEEISAAMALTLDDVKRVADLARVAIDEAEVRAVHGQINEVFKLIAEMQSVDTRQVPPMSHALDVAQRLRADAVTAADQHQLFQSVAPQVEADLYLVPKVIE